MPTIDEYRQRIGALEGEAAPNKATLAALVDAVCGQEWATHEERTQAQGLIARLERLLAVGQSPQGPAPPPETRRQALRPRYNRHERNPVPSSQVGNDH